MYSFDGQYKSRRAVSLGGASKKEKRTSLIQRTQAERQKREDLRKKNGCAITIQAFLRGEWVRHREHQHQRSSFDEIVESSTGQNPPDSTVTILLRKLIFFYSETKDSHRLVWLCQLLLKNRSVVNNLQRTDHQRWIHQLKRVVLICCRSLEVSLKDSKPVAIQLRMLEVFTSHESFFDSTNSSLADGSRKDAASVTVYLVRNGYFKYLRALLNVRVPSSLEPSPLPPTPLAAAIRDLIMSPLNLVTHSIEDSSVFSMQERHEVFRALVMDILAPEMSPQITCFLLPSLADPPSRFPFANLLDSLLSLLSKTGESGGGSNVVTPTPWLLYGVLVLAKAHLGPSSDLKLIKDYILVLQVLLFQLPQCAAGVDSDDEDSDSDSKMEVDPLQPSLQNLRESCLDIFDSKDHVKTLESLVTRQTDVYEKRVVTALCNICHFLMSESRLPIHKTRLLYTLALNPVFVRNLWLHVQSATTATNTGVEMPLLAMICRGTNLSTPEAEVVTTPLSLFCCLLSNALFSVHDKEFYEEEGQRSRFMPFPLSEIVRMSTVLREAIIGIIEVIYPETNPTFSGQYLAAMKSVGARSALFKSHEFYPKQKWIKLLKDVTGLVRQLHSRDSRRQFCPDGHWLSHKVNIDPTQMRIDGFLNEEGRVEGVLEPGTSSTTARNMAILRHIPFVVPFKDRVKLLQRIVGKNRVDSQGELHNFMMGPAIDVTINRNYIYQDAFDQLTEDKAPNLRQKLRVRMINAQGLEEAGVDGGGVFREFLSQLLKAGFDPNIGFFKSTHESLLYPNPQAALLARDYLKHYHFLGRMLGKALYENMLVELPFASFFLCKLLSKQGTDVDIHHLESLDPEMYRNLLFLRNYDGNVEDLSLNFTVVNNDLGENQVIELKPGGRDIPVTTSNRISYIHLVADYRLNKQIHRHCQAFRAGLSDVINLDWLRMFDHNELQVLISGALVPVDHEDLRRNTNYSGGFTEEHPCILSFWRAIEEFTDRQKRHLLKFVTSCSRPPLLGFKELHPPFCVHSAGPEDRLPTASTCMNLLKLPEYPDDETMKDRLLYAVESGAGFELS